MDLQKTAITKAESIAGELKKKNYTVSGIELKQYNYEFTVQLNREKFKVLIYFGKKGVTTVLQGNKESKSYDKIYNLVHDQSKLDFKNEALKEPDEYIGSDESGKGDYFGPLVVAAFYADKSIVRELAKFGVRDSKKISDSQIDALKYEIDLRFRENYKTITISPKRINELHTKFNNLNKLLNWAHSAAVEDLLGKFSCKTVITDKFESKDLILQQKNIVSNVEFIQTPKAEKFIAVAAASVVARSEFNNWFKETAKNGFLLPKGASGLVDNKAREILDSYGKDKLNELAKLHFKTTKKITG